LSHADQVFGFIIGIRNTSDEGKDLIKMGPRQGTGTWKMSKKRRGSHIYPFVGALGRQNHRYQQLIGIVEDEFGFSLRGVFTEPGYNKIESLFPGHLLERTEIKLK
jgi:hypothetical protein